MKEDPIKHLELLQAVITRMANNSFLLKGWTVTLTAALFALAAKDANPVFTYIALFPALTFWGLDAYYLRQERLFRKLYDDLRSSLSLETANVELFSLDVSKYSKQVPGWFRTLWSATVFWLHGIVVAVILVVMYLCLWVK
jgi:hypothetical protein